MNLKLHIVGISLLIVFALIGLVASGTIHFGEPPAAGATDPGDNFIRVDRASYGLNCEHQAKPYKLKTGELSPFRSNNVLKSVSLLCNGQTRCSFASNEATFGPLPPAALTCMMKLEVDYRCATFDHIRHPSAVGSDGNTLLDCDPSTRDVPAKKPQVSTFTTNTGGSSGSASPP